MPRYLCFSLLQSLILIFFIHYRILFTYSGSTCNIFKPSTWYKMVNCLPFTFFGTWMDHTGRAQINVPWCPLVWGDRNIWCCSDIHRALFRVAYIGPFFCFPWPRACATPLYQWVPVFPLVIPQIWQKQISYQNSGTPSGCCLPPDHAPQRPQFKWWILMIQSTMSGRLNIGGLICTSVSSYQSMYAPL